MSTYLRNLLHIKKNQRTLDPRLAIYYITTHCNLNCTYCEDFGAQRNADATTSMLDDAKKILKIIRDGVDNLWITGGEPLLAPHLLDLLDYARDDLLFREISLITNGTLLSQNLDLLALVDRLIISLDSLDSSALESVSLKNEQSQNLIKQIEEIAPLQKEKNFKLILNAVITPETLPNMDSLINFCAKNKIWLSFSPQAVNNWIHFDLATSAEYRAFIKNLLERKKRGAPILGSNIYLKTLLDQKPYECYPTIIPRIMPDGWLIYPCLPMEKEGGEVGGRPVNLLNVQSWAEAWQIAKERYGEAPSSCTSCFQQCYAEPSLMQAHPLAWISEYIRTGIDLGTYAPG
ncbi:MAG: radical SAM protein [Anaerolineae bacterium]|jgi:MoaA/NifB/PqqE/SkfB family radical SAM enzyme|nr:radical SAM protein [Anaerolineae bacterium]MBT7075644.1 radical SAM protein [Anaerolineae bacterium]MBT7781468.1 radical SAM protein [Anaerolineae bacterium]